MSAGVKTTQAGRSLVDLERPVCQVTVDPLDHIGIDPGSARLIAQRSQVDLGPQCTGDRLGVPGLQVGGSFLLPAPE